MRGRIIRMPELTLSGYGSFLLETSLMCYLKKILSNMLRAILLIALLLSHGGGSTVLQGVAWISMFTGELEKDSSLEQALVSTFDGEEPCPLCHAADNLRQSEQEVPNPKNNDPNPLKSAAKKLSDGFMFSETEVPKVKVSECDRGWIEFSKPWLSWLIVDVVTPPPRRV